MRTMRLPFIATIAAVIIIILSSAIFEVHQTQSALILQFGKLVRVIKSPGLNLKVPFIQDVIYYDNRLLHYNLPPLEVNAADQKRLVVDLYTRYKIVDVIRFYRAIGQDTSKVEPRLSGIVLDLMQQVIGRIPLNQMLSNQRPVIMQQIHAAVRRIAFDYGIDVVDVRIIRADLPKENSEAIFTRMESERLQEAKLFRAEGDELNQGIRAKAERERVIILADAKKKADILRGQGEAEATKIYAKAYGAAPKFFEFYRSLQAYRVALDPSNTTVILSPSKTPFLKYMSTQPSLD